MKEGGEADAKEKRERWRRCEGIIKKKRAGHKGWGLHRESRRGECREGEWRELSFRERDKRRNTRRAKFKDYRYPGFYMITVNAQKKTPLFCRIYASGHSGAANERIDSTPFKGVQMKE